GPPWPRRPRRSGRVGLSRLRPPPRRRRPLPQDTLGLALVLHEPGQARLERLLNEVLPGFPVLDDLVEERCGWHRSSLPRAVEDDLGQCLGRQIVAGHGVDHADLPTLADELLELL